MNDGPTPTTTIPLKDRDPNSTANPCEAWLQRLTNTLRFNGFCTLDLALSFDLFLRRLDLCGRLLEFDQTHGGRQDELLFASALVGADFGEAHARSDAPIAQSDQDCYDDDGVRDKVDPPGQAERNHNGRDDHVEDGQGQQTLPAQAHQLVIANTGQRGAQPDEQEEEQGHFDQENDD